MHARISFYKMKKKFGDNQSSLEAKLLLPLKTLAYGVPAHTFIDYFQMSKEFARSCCIEFDKAIRRCYEHMYLKLPTALDLKRICALHKNVHIVDGLVGSLDCCHTFWKNCPKAWAGSYKGKEKKPSIVLEAVADYHLFLWHASYGYTGNLNDLTILSLSPLLDRMVDGTIHDLEKEAGVVPFKIGRHQFNETFLLTDGIYPSYSRFVKGIKEPITVAEKRYTGWQEACRKDIERAFGVLQNTWQFIQRPILLHSLKDISQRVTCCIILHNMLVSDRVMDDPRMDYDPTASYDTPSVIVQQPSDLRQVQGGSAGVAGGTGLSQAPQDVAQLVTRAGRFKQLRDKQQHEQLHNAIMEYLGDNNYQ